MIAPIVSRILEPMVVLTGLLVAGGMHAGLTGAALVRYYVFLFSFAILPATIFRFWYRFKHNVDWDIKDRKKRIFPLFLQLVFLVAGTLYISQWGNQEVTKLFTTLLIWLAGFFAITTVWKISGHTSTLALATGLIVLWYGWSWWWILLTVPLVSWARVRVRDHTTSQVIAGAAYSWILLLIL